MQHGAKVLLWCEVFFLICTGTSSLRMVEVVIPNQVPTGQDVALKCRFDLDQDKLYAVKWYKDNEEFYRYIARYNPPYKTFNIEGVTVKVTNSNDQQVELSAVTVQTEGNYKCEVSAEAPSFSSVAGEGRMEVLHIPSTGPNISGSEASYGIGDMVDVNCTSAKSHPAANITWYINDKEANPADVIHYDDEMYEDGLKSSWASLRFRLQPDHFRGGKVKLRCVARMSSGPQFEQLEPVAYHQGDSPMNGPPSMEALLFVTKSGDVAISVSPWTTLMLAASFYLLIS